MSKNLIKEKEYAAKEASKLLKDNQIVGLGTGSTAYYAIIEIGKLVSQGLNIRAIPTSEESMELAKKLGIPLIDINTVDHIDITFDGADEFTSDLQLIKGGGGALLREKIIASLTMDNIIIADSSKKVALLGKFTLPIEVIPMAYQYVLARLQSLGGKGTIRKKDDVTFITDEGNYIIDTDFGLIENPSGLALELNQIVGLVEHGLFLNLAKKVIMGNGETVVTFD
jgi:ribose 5-phosphate isomerase A